MRAYQNCTTATSSRFNLFAGSAGPAHRWTDAERAAYALTIARNNLDAAQGRYRSACAALGQANRLKGYARRRYQVEAFRTINSARRQIRAARQALTAAMAHPALAIDQAPA